MKVINPATEEAFANCPRASVDHLNQAVAAARAAFPARAATSMGERRKSHRADRGRHRAEQLGDARPATVAKSNFDGAFQNSGQVCLAIKRRYVHESIYDELAELADAVILGDGSKQGAQLGLLQNRMQYEKVKGFPEDARKNGTIVAGGEVTDRPGFIRPTIVRDITEGSRLEGHTWQYG
jgi:acyl-CoA reductase-like NAD-dependent aldehyde dehydrogenase